MATAKWTSGSGSFTSSGWSGGSGSSGRPAVTDDVQINGGTITAAAATPNFNSLTVAATASLLPNGNAINVTGAAGISNAGVITGAGTVAANIGADAGTISASAGTLHLTGTVASGPTLAIANVAGSVLSIENTATAAAPIAIANNTQTLAIGASGALTINGGAESITNGTISLAGGTLTDASGLTIGSSATLTGKGTVAANIGAGTGTITANGGILHLTGTVASGPALTIANVASSVLSIENTATAAAPIAIANSTQTLAIGASGALTINGGAESITNGTISLAGGTLTDASGLTIGSSATLTGKGTVAANIGAGTGTITANGGTLHLTGTVASGPALTIANVASSVLSIENTATAAAPIAIANSTQTLAIGASGALTINGGAESITNGTISLAGGTLTDASGLTIGSSATLTGKGTVAANIGAGTGTITANGGTLHLTGTVASGPALTIANVASSVLSIENTATAAAPIAIANSTQTLAIGASGALTINGGAESITNGTISLAGGTLTDSSGATLGAGSRLTGFGTFNAAFTGSNSGTATALGGALVLKSNIAASSGLTFNIADSSASILRLDGTVGSTNTFNFVGTHGALELNDVTITPTGLNFAGAVSGLDVTASALPDLSTIDYVNVQGIVTKAVLTDSTHIELFNSSADLGTITLASATSATHVDWGADSSFTGHTIGSGTDIFLSSVVCYGAGTRILTATGEQRIDDLQEGDLVLTLSGDELTAQPVKWIGRRRIDLTAHPYPETVAPVRIGRGAFAEAMPHTDLLVSPDHGIFVDGQLICARQLINGTTIYQEKGWTAVDYFHIELDSHAILLAEGLPAESYLDTGNHGFFANSDEPLVLHPDLTDETDYPTREAGSCVPFVWDEASVYPVWRRLAERAETVGQPASSPETTKDPQLCIVVEGRTVRPVHCKNGLYTFALPKGATEIRLVSRAGSPTDVRPWLNDRRSLGVNVERIVLRSEREVRIVPLDQPGLSQGWWPVEQDGIALSRWTNAEAVVSLPSMDGPAMLEIRAGCGEMSYLVTAAQASLAA